MLKCEVVPPKRPVLPLVSVLAALGLWGAISAGQHLMRSFTESKVELSRRIVRHYAHKTYSEWLGLHPDEPCPTMAQLEEVRDIGRARDPWGVPLWRGCGPGPQIRVVSAGPDGTFGTADDIDSRE